MAGFRPKNRRLFDEDDPYSTDPFYKELDERIYGSEETQPFQVPQQTTRYPESRPDLNEFEKGFGAGVDQLQALYGGAKAALGSAFDNEEWVNEGLDYYQEQMREAMQYSPDVAFEDDWDEEGFVEGISNFADWLAYTAGNVAPSLIGTIGTGGAGGALVGGTVLGGKKLAQWGLKKKTEKRLKEKFENTAKDIAEAQLGKEARQEYAAKVAKKYAKYGSAAGGFAFSAGMGTGENFGRIYEETGLEDPGAAISLGIVMGALDLAGAPFRAFKKAFPGESLDKLKEDLSQAALNDRSRIKKMFDAVLDPETRPAAVGSEILQAGSREAVTEAMQEWMSRISVVWAAENLSEEDQARFIDYLSREDAWSSYIHAAAAGAVGGSMVGGPTGLVGGPSPKGRARREVMQGKEPATEIEEQQEKDKKAFSVEAEKQREQVLIDARETASETFENYEPDLVVPEEADTPAIPPALQDYTENTLDVIEFGAGVDAESLAQENDIPLDDQQELLDTMESMGLISSEITPDGITYSVLRRPEETPAVAEEAPTVAEPEQQPATVTDIKQTPSVRDQFEQQRALDEIPPGTQPQQELSIITITDPNLEPVGGKNKIKKGEMYETEGEVEVVFPDGDRYVLSQDAETNEYFETSQEIQGFYPTDNKSELIDQLKNHRARIVEEENGDRVQPKEERFVKDDSVSRIADFVEAEFDKGKTVSQDRIRKKFKKYNESQFDYLFNDEDVLNSFVTEGDWLFDADTKTYSKKPDQNTQEITVPDSIAGLTGMERERARFQQRAQVPTLRATLPEREYTEIMVSVAGEMDSGAAPIKDRLEAVNQQDGTTKSQPNGEDQVAVRSLGSYSSFVSKLAGVGGISPDGSIAGKPEETLKSLVDEYNVQDVDQSPEAKTMASILVEAVERGLPVEAVQNLTGVYVFEGNREGLGEGQSTAAGYGISTRSLLVNKDELQAATTDPNARKNLLFFVSHELYHSIDNAQGFTENMLGMQVGMAKDEQGAVQIELDELTAEMYEAYLAQNDLGRTFNYPLDSISQKVAEEKDTINLDDTAETIRSELFAQAGAVFATNPLLLKRFAPKTYRMMLDLQRDPTPLTEDANEIRVQTKESTDSQREGVPGQIRAPPVDRGVEVSDPATDRRPSERGVGEGRADSGVEGQTPAQDGDDTGQAVQLRGRQAKAGGEYGLNGEFYRGGQFMPSSAFTEKGKYKVQKTRGTGRQLIAPGEFALPPEGQRSLFSRISQFITYDEYEGGALTNAKVRDYNVIEGATPPKEEIQAGIEAFNKGVRFVDIEQSSDPDFQEIILSDLSQPSQKVTASTILYGDESPIQIEGKPTVVKVATALDQRVAEAYGDTNLGEQTDANVEIISDLIAHEATEALYQEGNAGEWYQEKVANAMSLAAQRFPELSTDPNAKFAFTAIMAVTSNGASVPENSVNTFKLYEQYRQTKQFKIFGVGKEAQAMKNSFRLLNDLIDATGVDSVREFMDQDITVKELKEDFGLTVSGELMGTKLKGSAILGPKIGGGFYQNLNGNFDPLTMDRWFMRTYGRLTGTLMSEAKRKLPAQIDKFRKVALSDSYRSKLKKDGINRNKLKKDDEYLLAYANQIQSAYAKGGFKEKNTLNKASNTLKNSQAEKQAPQNGTEREFIRRVMQKSLDKVNEINSNNPVNMGALQAIIWYPEKQLYKVHGVGNAKSEPTDYETEFRKIIEGEESGQGVSGPDRSAQQSGSGDVQRGTVEPDGNQEQDDSAAVQETNQRIRFKPGKPDLTPNPRIKRAYQELQDGLITKQEYNEIVTLTVFPYEASPDPASVPEMEGALNKSQVNSINVLVEEGEVVGIRLDINAYENKGVWVSTIHMDKRPKGSVKKSYRATAAIKNVSLIQPEDEKSQRKAREVMEGVKNKSPFAQIRGEFINRTDEENASIADEAINSPEWTQIGYDPRRRSMFYDRANGDPILFADEVVQIGPLVLGKNVERGNIDDFQYMVLPSGNKPNAEFNLTDELVAEAESESAVTRWFGKDLASKVADKYNLWQTVEKAMAKAMGLPRLPSEMSFRDAENLMHSKLQEQIEKFEEKYVKGIGELAKKYQLNVDQIGLYLLAKHAPERNAAMLAKEQERRAAQIASLEEQILSSDNEAEVARLEGKLEQLNEAPFRYIETGSGMTDAQAQQVLDNAEEAGNADQYEEIADQVYTMLDEMRQGMVDKGLLDEQSKADWEATYQFYVPLKGFQDTDGTNTGGPGSAGFNIRGPESMKARGRVSLPQNPLLMAIKDAESKIIRAEKNKVAQRLLKLVESYQSSEWNVYNNKFRAPSLTDPGEMQTLEQMQRDINPRTGLPRYLQIKRGGQTFFVEIKNPALAKQLHQADPQTLNSAGEVMGHILKASRKINNFRRKMIINYNPSWGLVNPIRDIETGLAFLLSEQSKLDGRVKGHKLVGKVFLGWKKAYLAYRRHQLDLEAKSPEQQEIFGYIDDYIADGAPTGLATMKDLDQLRSDIEKELGAQPMRVWGTDIKIAGAPDFRNYAKKKMERFIDLVEAFNIATENAIRLSSYIESRKAGIPRLDAATLAKDLTTNFNRKGEYSSQIDAMYLFFNAAIQGNVNMKDALVGSTSAKDKASLLGIKATRNLFYGLFAFGFGRTMMNIMMAEEDDDGESKYKDFNPFTLQTTATIMGWTPEDTAVGLPLPYGWGWVDNMGRIMAEQMMGIRDPAESAVDALTVSLHHFSPRTFHAVRDDIDGLGAGIQASIGVAPDALAFVAEQGMDVNFFGAPVVIPTPYTDPPASSVAKRGTLEVFKSFASGLNDLTGGTDSVSGVIDISPDRLQHAFDWMLGGLGRFGTDAVDTAQKTMTPEDDLAESDFPISRRFYFNPSEYNDQFRYYDNRRELAQEMDGWKDDSKGRQSLMETRKKLVERRSIGYYTQLDDFRKAADKQLRANRQLIKQLERSDTGDVDLRIRNSEKISRLEARNQLIYDKFNKRYDELK